MASRSPHSSSSVSSRLHHLAECTYALDYLGLLLLALSNLSLLFVMPFHRLFSLDDRAIAYPHAEHERVPVPMLFFYASALPVLVICAYCGVSALLARQCHHDYHGHQHQKHKHKHLTQVALMGLAAAIMLGSFITDVVKNGVGRPRPDLLDRCKPRNDTPLHELVDYTVCTAPRGSHLLEDGFRSFPSGHSSFSWSGLGYLGMFLAGQLRVFVQPRGGDMASAVISMVPLVGALLITISRTEDYRHDVYDVTTGTLIGVFAAYFSYRQYFPALASRKCDQPYRKSTDDENDEGWGRGRDREAGFERLPDMEMTMVGGR